MGRTTQLVVASLVCWTGVITLAWTNTVWSLLLAIFGLVLVLRIVVKSLEEHGRRSDPDFDKHYAAQARKWQFYMMTFMMTFMMFAMILWLFPLSSWMFWVCMALLILNTVFMYSQVRKEL